MSRIGVFFGQGYEEIEALTVVDLCRRAGLEVEMAAVGDVLQVPGAHGIGVTMDETIEQVDFSNLDMIVLPGGIPGVYNLESCGKLMEQVADFMQKGKSVAAICAAPTILGHKGLVQGKRACCYPDMEGELTGAEVSYDKVTVDGNLITSRGMGTAIEFSLAIIAHFLGQDSADALAAKIVYSRV